MPHLDTPAGRFHYHRDDFSDPWQPRAPVLLCHAAGGNLHRWRMWVPVLARQRPVLRFDMRGHGATPPAAAPLTLPGLAADIAAMLDGLGVDRVHLVGASGGGIVCLRFAIDYPQRLHSLTLVASTPKLAQMGASVNAGAWRGILETQGTRAWLLANANQRFGPNADPRVIKWYAAEGERTPAPAVLALQRCLLAEDLTPLLPRIAEPVLLLAAEQDDITPLEMQHLIAERIPNARLETFSGVGHNLKVEIPDTLAQRTAAFMAEVEGAYL